MVVKVCFVLYFIVLLYYGFYTKKPNWLGWFMFVRGSYCYANLKSKKTNINIWEYFPHCQVIIHKEMMVNLLSFLREEKGIKDIRGYFILYTPNNIKKYPVNNSHVVFFGNK